MPVRVEVDLFGGQHAVLDVRPTQQAALFDTALPADLERERKLAAAHYAEGGRDLIGKEVIHVKRRKTATTPR